MRSFVTALLLVASIPSGLAQNTGTLAGCVFDADTGEPLIGANVWVSEIERGAIADIDGCYLIHEVPVGMYTVRFCSAGFDTQVVSQVEIVWGRTRTLDPMLEPSRRDWCGLVHCSEEPLLTNDIYTVRQYFNEGGGRRLGWSCCPLSGNDVLLSNLPVER